MRGILIGVDPDSGLSRLRVSAHQAVPACWKRVREVVHDLGFRQHDGIRPTTCEDLNVPNADHSSVSS